jgi:hypothetical protein
MGELRRFSPKRRVSVAAVTLRTRQRWFTGKGALTQQGEFAKPFHEDGLRADGRMVWRGDARCGTAQKNKIL